MVVEMDNILHFVRRTSRSFRKGSSVHPQADCDAGSEDETKAAITELCGVFVNSDSSYSLEERKRAVKDIGHLIWTRGCDAAVFAAEKCLPPFSHLLLSEDAASLQQDILSTLSEMLQSAIGDQRVAHLIQECHLPKVLIQLLSSQDQSIVQWCLHAMLFLCCGSKSPKKMFSSEEISILKARTLELSVVDWSAWRHNEADELAKWLQQSH
jgi:hypothetical protein